MVNNRKHHFTLPVVYETKSRTSCQYKKIILTCYLGSWSTWCGSWSGESWFLRELISWVWIMKTSTKYRNEVSLIATRFSSYMVIQWKSLTHALFNLLVFEHNHTPRCSKEVSAAGWPNGSLLHYQGSQTWVDYINVSIGWKKIYMKALPCIYYFLQWKGAHKRWWHNCHWGR